LFSTDNSRPREGTVNFIHSSTNYELAVQHGHDLTDAAERRRQTRRFQHWITSRHQSGPAGTGGR